MRSTVICKGTTIIIHQTTLIVNNKTYSHNKGNWSDYRIDNTHPFTSFIAVSYNVRNIIDKRNNTSDVVLDILALSSILSVYRISSVCEKKNIVVPPYVSF